MAPNRQYVAELLKRIESAEQTLKTLNTEWEKLFSVVDGQKPVELARQRPIRERIIEVLTAAGTEALSKDQIADAIPEWKDTSVHQTLSKMAGKREIGKLGHSRYCLLETSQANERAPAREDLGLTVLESAPV